MNSSGKGQWSLGDPRAFSLFFSDCSSAGQAHLGDTCFLPQGVEGRYLEGVSWLALERDHVIHQVALTSLHPVTGHGWFWTAAQAHR